MTGRAVIGLLELAVGAGTSDWLMIGAGAATLAVAAWGWRRVRSPASAWRARPRPGDPRPAGRASRRRR